MRLKEICEIIEASYVVQGEEDFDIYSACACDLMSDVLAFVKEQSMLLTGLNNPQVIRTAEMMDMKAVVFVRGKMPEETVVALAREKGIALLSTPLTMYVCAGKLYSNGLICSTKRSEGLEQAEA